MKDARDAEHRSTGRDLAVVKTSVVDEAFDKLGLTMRSGRSSRQMITTGAFEAGSAAGAGLKIG